jgi:hypothetical protein
MHSTEDGTGIASRTEGSFLPDVRSEYKDGYRAGSRSGQEYGELVGFMAGYNQAIKMNALTPIQYLHQVKDRWIKEEDVDA